MSVVTCPECGGEVDASGVSLVGEIVPCPECGVELEVMSVDPLDIAVAAEVEEDWGE